MHAMNPLLPAVLALMLAAPLAQAGESVGKTVEIKVEAQGWQTRRAGFARIVNALAEKDPKTIESFKAVLSEFEQQPFTRTPMENMEILGVYYVPAEGIEPTLYLVAANAALGWYDALRFASESGRSEILHNEGFFKLPFMLGGEQYTTMALKFFSEHPDKTAQEVQRGLALAARLKDDPRYDHQWPSAYGLERMLCAMGQECTPPGAIAQSQWDAAWQEAQERVQRYYRINPPATPEKPSTAAPRKKKR